MVRRRRKKDRKNSTPRLHFLSCFLLLLLLLLPRFYSLIYWLWNIKLSDDADKTSRAPARKRSKKTGRLIKESKEEQQKKLASGQSASFAYLASLGSTAA